MELEEILPRLRARGASIVDSLKIVREIEHVTLGQAKAVVDESPTWADMRLSNRELREVVAEAWSNVDE